MTNPLRTIHDGIWTMLEANTDFGTLVVEGNRIKYGGEEIEPWPTGISESDVPEVGLWCSGGFWQAQQSSSGSRPEVDWKHLIVTGQRGQWRALDAMWYIYAAWSKWQTHLETLTWNSEKLVWLARLGRAIVHEPSSWPDKERGLNGWVIEVPATTWVTVATSDLQA